MRTPVVGVVALALTVAACHPNRLDTRVPAGQWMTSARETVHNTCTDEADNTGAAGAVWTNVYNQCAARVVNQLLLSPTRPAGTNCAQQPTWCHG